MPEGQMTQSTYLQIDACPARIDALETSKADQTALAAETAAREAADAKHDAALIALIDSGAKNYINALDIDAIKSRNTSGTWSDSTYTRYNIEYTINGDGTISLRTIGGAASSGGALVIPCRELTGDTYHLSGCPAGASGYDIRLGSGSTYRDTGSGAEFTVTGNFTIYIRVDSGTNIPDAVTLSPMLCLKSASIISERYVPYCPTLSEMYEMILAGSAASVNSLQQTAQLAATPSGTGTEGETK